MSRKKWTILEKLLWVTPLLFVGVASASFWAPSARSLEAMLEVVGLPSREASRQRACQMNLKQITLATHQYLQDWDEHLPPSATVSVAVGFGPAFGWADLLRPYLKSTAVFHCPKNSQVVSSNPLARGYTDYFYSARLSGLPMANVPDTALTVMMGDGVSSNARYALVQPPPQWMKGENSPLRRHFEPKTTRRGANYAFVDGHIKWLQPQQVGTAGATAGGFTFSIR